MPLLLLAALVAATTARGDWPTYRADAARSAATSESLPGQLAERWRFACPHPPRPAWPTSRRIRFDVAAQPVVADDRVVFGSSADDTVRCLDLASGRLLWQYRCDAPIRLTPALWRDRCFVASDDGHLYAIGLADGRLLWKRRGGPTDEMVLGNERLVSKWPARGGPVVADDTVYFAAGIWPSDGIFVYAVDAATGQVRWVNDTAGRIDMPQPHGGANAVSGISAQGHLVVAGDRLLVPTGRAVPAVLDRRTGKLSFFHLQQFGQLGGTSTMAVGDVFFNSGSGFELASGKRIMGTGQGQLAAAGDTVFRADGGTLTTLVQRESSQVDRRGEPVSQPVLQPQWTTPNVRTGAGLIVAGNTVVTGGRDGVDLVDVDTHEIVWSGETTGAAHGLCASDGCLLVGTDQGVIHCFAESDEANSTEIKPPSDDRPFGDNRQAAELAEQILRESGVRQGYCVDLGCGDGALAFELARRSQLHVYAVDTDPRAVAAAREKLAAAGLYGSRVTAHHRDPNATGYPPYFADLVVSYRAAHDAQATFAAAEAARLQRPCGGVMCVGRAGKWSVARRGPLEGAGQWTHQYANPANTVCSDDRLIRGQLGMLWFRDLDFPQPQRHGRGPSPLYANGRLFGQGLDGVVAIDAYNGRELWRFDIPGVLTAYDGDELMGVSGAGSNYCLGDDCVFVRDGQRCLQIDAATGQLRRELTPPAAPDGEPGTWGYVACADGVLLGSVANTEHVVTYRYVNRGGDMSRQHTESHSLFAVDPADGALRWRFDAAHSIRHNAIAVAQGRVVLIDRPLALFDRQKKPETKDHPPGRLVCLDLAQGKTLWANDEEIFGATLAVSEPHRIVLMSYQPTRFRLDSELGGRMAAIELDTGRRLWDIEAKYTARPIINDTTVLAEGGAWDLLTGKPRPMEFHRSYGCGILAASRHMLVFRSATLGYRDLTADRGTENYGGIRPGCWINVLPAGGLVLAPDTVHGCVCSYLNRAWIALRPLPVRP